jgi:hypothetical protein
MHIGLVFVRQARHSLAWMAAFFEGVVGSLVRSYEVWPTAALEDSSFVATDASPWGIGGILVIRGQVVAYFADIIQDDDLVRFRAKRGDSAFMTIWEAVAMLVAVRSWLPTLPHMALQVRGDSMGALLTALKLKARDPHLNAVAREIALDSADNLYQIQVLRHVPGVANIIPDALSRLSCPSPKALPREVAAATRIDTLKRDSTFWRTWASPPPGGQAGKRKR